MAFDPTWTEARHPAGDAFYEDAQEGYVITGGGTTYGFVTAVGDWVHVDTGERQGNKSFPVARVLLIEWA